MAHTWVYCHDNKGNNYSVISDVKVYHGQLLFYTGNWWYTYDWKDSEMLQPILQCVGSGCVHNEMQPVIHAANGDGALVKLEYANIYMYGSYNYHSQSGGCFYSIRNTTRIRTLDNSQVTYLYPGSRVIIGVYQGYTNNNNFSLLRAWGYKRSDGTIIETYDRYVENVYITNPINYELNTK